MNNRFLEAHKSYLRIQSTSSPSPRSHPSRAPIRTTIPRTTLPRRERQHDQPMRSRRHGAHLRARSPMRCNAGGAVLDGTCTSDSQVSASNCIGAVYARKWKQNVTAAQGKLHHSLSWSSAATQPNCHRRKAHHRPAGIAVQNAQHVNATRETLA